MKPLFVASLMLFSFFGGFFLAWYAIRSAYQHRFNKQKVAEVAKQTTHGTRERSVVDLIDSSPEVVTVTNLPEEALSRYIHSITQKHDANLAIRLSRVDEPTLKISKNSKDSTVTI